ncbi:MAG TPA: protoporphyrinogen IX oxidase, partial [Flavobacterium sp.]|nr:protoporphyrinogen IX oxidase [Flavobacterium sp.]
NHSSNFFRVWNEGATIILFAVVFLVILKTAFDWIYGVIGIFVFSITIMIGYKFYEKIREK